MSNEEVSKLIEQLRVNDNKWRRAHLVVASELDVSKNRNYIQFIFDFKKYYFLKKRCVGEDFLNLGVVVVSNESGLKWNL